MEEFSFALFIQQVEARQGTKFAAHVPVDGQQEQA
jgi:hypothetical protein